MGKGGSGGKGGGSGKGGSGGKSGSSGRSSISKSDASRIQSAGARNPQSPTAKGNFDERAQSAADRHTNSQQDR